MSVYQEWILSPCQSVIKARSATYGVFQRIASANPDPEIERSNAAHKRFIDTLGEAFTSLGGHAWREKQKTQESLIDQVDLDELKFANTFSGLNIGQGGDDEESAGEGPSQPSATTTANRSKKQGPGKRKKGKKGKAKPKTPAKEPDLDEVPLESYRIIEDEDGIITDYLMAVYASLREWCEMRKYLQGLWRQVAYGGLNSAVAGEMCNIAVAMVKQAEAAIFVDFPGHESFETISQTITRGNIEKAMGNFSISLHRMDSIGSKVEKVREAHVDVREEFFIHTYQTLLDFANDFKLNRTGKPTKRMQAELRNWDPNFDLQKATKDDRIKWRRIYAINWLYDLVNLFSSIVMQRINMKGQKWVLEDVDWSPNGPWDQHRRLFGLNEVCLASSSANTIPSKMSSMSESKIMSQPSACMLHMYIAYECGIDCTVM